MEFYITTSEIKKNEGAYKLFNKFRHDFIERDGYCYHKYPIAGGAEVHLPDVIMIDLDRGILIFDVLSDLTLHSIEEIQDECWKINESLNDSPLLKLEDYKISLENKYQKFRQLRGKIEIKYFLVLPIVSKEEFTKKFSSFQQTDIIIFDDYLKRDYSDLFHQENSISTDLKPLFRSVSQGAGKLNDFKSVYEKTKVDNIGKAINLINTKINYLAKEQHAAAIQIPDGPQRIRGMAGTGKTIILTMKAAFLHSMFNDKKILYTFNTQSLYNQVKNLISGFYRDNEDKDPDWENYMHVMHGWGSSWKKGVYYRTCMKNLIEPMNLRVAQSNNPNDPFDFACSELLNHKLEEEYDFVLLDEAQDFSSSFFKLLYAITKPPKRIIFAYDELQNLSTHDILDTGELFGYNLDGSKKVDFSAGQYEGGIDMDYTLKISYRNPLNVLMVAHSLGMGLKNTAKTMQIIKEKNVWDNIGYKVLSGNLGKIGEKIVVTRPPENSISIVHEFYSGTKKNLEYTCFEGLDARNDELEWVAKNISNDIKNENVKPEDIIVISLVTRQLENFYSMLQFKLNKYGVASLIPGLKGISRDVFREEGFVTLSTVFKAKGNEAFIVYITAFDYLYNALDFVEGRNKAFTSISRAKGWCRITGIGENMKRAIKEIQDTEQEIPNMSFMYPEDKFIARSLSQEELAKKLYTKKQQEKVIKDLLVLDIEEETLTEDQKEALRKKLGL